MSTTTMADAADASSSDPSCSSCAKLKEELDASKKEHSLTLRMVKEKIISTDELIKKYQQKCHESEKHHQQAADFMLKLEAAQMEKEALQSQLERSLHSTEPLRKNAARLHREKTMADSTISELREKVQRLETLNSELMSTAKLKDEQECAWRLEKQVQAQEVQKQKKSLDKSETTIAKLQEQLKKGKEQNKEINKSLMQANRKVAKLEQQLMKSKQEIESVKRGASFANILGDERHEIQRTPKPRQKRKTKQVVQPCRETKQASSPVSYSNQQMAHIIQELKELSDIGPSLSPLPPSPDGGSLESSSSEESDSDSGSEDDRKASDDGDSDSSLGDLANMLIGVNSESGELVVSPLRTGVDTLSGDEENDNKSSEDPANRNSNVKNKNTEREESLANCEGQSNPEREITEHETCFEHSGVLADMDKTSDSEEKQTCDIARTKKRDEECSMSVTLSSASKFTVVSPSRQRKAKRRVMSPKPRVMTRSRTKAMKLSVSSEADSSPEKETGKDLNSSRGHCSETSDTDVEYRGNASKVRKLKGDKSDNEGRVAVEEDVRSSYTISDSPERRKSGELSPSEVALARLDTKVTNKDNSNTFSKGVDYVTNNGNDNSKPAKLDVENKQELSSTSQSAAECTALVSTLMKQRNDLEQIPSSEHSINNTDNFSARSVNEVENEVTVLNVTDQTSPHGSINAIVSENTFVSQLQNKGTVVEQKEAALEENNNEILEDFEDIPEPLEFDSPSVLSMVVDMDSSDQNESLLGETSTISSCTIGKEAFCLPALSSPAVVCDENESSMLEQVSSLSEEEIIPDSVSCKTSVEEVAVETTKDEIPEGSNTTAEIDANSGTSIKATRSSAEKRKDRSSGDSNLAIREDVRSHSPSTPKGETLRVSSSTMEVDANRFTTATTLSTPTRSSVETCTDRNSEDTNLALKEEVISHTSGDARQDYSVKEAATEYSKTKNTVSQKKTSGITAEHSTNQKGRTHNDFRRDIPCAISQEVEESSISNEERNRSNFGSRTRTDRPVRKETGSSLYSLDVESDLEGSEPMQSSLSPIKADSFEKTPVKIDLQDNLAIPSLMRNLVELIGDQLPTLSPLPPSPCPSDDEACLASPVGDLVSPIGDLIGDFPPLSPLPPSPCSLVDEVSPDSPLSISDFSKQTEQSANDVTMVGTTSPSPQQQSNYTELSSKNVKRTSLGNNSFGKTTKTDDRDVSTPVGDSKSLKRSLQQSVSESTKNINVVSQCKKMKMQQNVNEKQDSPTLYEGIKMSSVLASIPSTNSVHNDVPVMRKHLRQQSKNVVATDGPVMPKQMKQPSTKIGAREAPKKGKSRNGNNSAETAEHKEGKFLPLSNRPKSQAEVLYARRCLHRLHKNNVELDVVVHRLTSRKCISSCTPLASAIVQFLKQRDDDLMSPIMDQIEQCQSDESSKDWQPVKSGFEARLLDVVNQISRGDTILGNLIPQLVSLCSRILITACFSSKDDDFKGALSLCRVFTALCQLKEDLDYARVVCYDVMRSLCGFQKAALELVVSMVTVWPEVLKTSANCLCDEQSPLVQSLKIVLLNWADSASSTNLGTILRTVCCWGDDPVMQETVQDHGLQLITWLLNESMTSVRIGEDGNLVTDRHSFELVKSLELLSCVLGWQWTVNELIINGIWTILETWANGASNEEMGGSADGPESATASTSKQSDIVEAGQSSSTGRNATCCCQTSSNESIGKTVLSVGEIEGKGACESDRLGSEGGREICSDCGQLTKHRLAESGIIVCIQLLGVLCRIGIENEQTAVPEIMDLLSGLMEETSPNSKVTYAIQLAAAVSLLDMSPWQPERVVTVLSEWLTSLKVSGSLQAPTCVTQGLVCLKSILRSTQTWNDPVIPS